MEIGDWRWEIRDFCRRWSTGILPPAIQLTNHKNSCKSVKFVAKTLSRPQLQPIHHAHARLAAQVVVAAAGDGHFGLDSHLL